MSELGDLTREDLRARYGVESEFARVKDVSRITGISAATIYTQIRQGAFPIPVRRVGDMPLIRVDHLLAWLNEPGEAGRAVIRVENAEDRAPGEPPLRGQASPAPDRTQLAIEKALRSVDEARARRARKIGGPV